MSLGDLLSDFIKAMMLLIRVDARSLFRTFLGVLALLLGLLLLVSVSV